MQVMNYYAMSQEELEKKIDQIRNWLFDYPGHKNYARACFALDVALCALELKKEPVDDFTQLVIDTLC